MYTANLYPPTFYHQYTTQFFPAAPDAQPRVGNSVGKRNLLPKSEYSYSFYLIGIILGSLILILSLTLLATEITRVYCGSINRSRNNTNETLDYWIYQGNTVGVNQNVQSWKPQNLWLWPWSTPTLLFSLLFITTSILGIVSGRRETYSAILAFFICSLLSLFLLIFVITSYSITISGWKTLYDTNSGKLMPSYARLDRNLSIACLSFSCILFSILFASIILSGLTIDICTRKDFTEQDT